MKTCTRCGEVKELEGFYGPYSRIRGSGYMQPCRDCYVQLRKAKWRDPAFREVDLARNASWQRSNKEKVRVRNNKWRVRNRATVALRQERYRARKIGADGRGIDTGAWHQMCADNGGLCSYCGKPSKLTMDHVVPLRLGGHHDTKNIVPACKPCNSKKQALPLLSFLYRQANV